MIDYDDDYISDYKGRDIKTALEEARQMVDTILTPPDKTPLEVRKEIVVRPKDLQQWVDLGLEGKETIPVESQEVVFQVKFRA